MKSVSSSRSEPLPPVWMGALVRPTTERDAPDHDTGARPLQASPFARARRERLTDVVLAVTYVAGCALMGWAGAAWL